MNDLTKYFRSCDDLNTKFEGSYQLLKYIVEKYGIYNSQITKFITENNYGISASSKWRKEKVPNKVWNLVHKDLIMLRLMGKILEHEVMTLEELEAEFNFLTHS
jgi:hypothetical protein